MNSYYPPPSYNPPPYIGPNRPNPNRIPVQRAGNVVASGLFITLGLMILLNTVLGMVFYALDQDQFSIQAYNLVKELIPFASYVMAFWVAIVFIMIKTDIPRSFAFPLRPPKASLCIPAIFVGLGASVIGVVASTMFSGLLEGITGYRPVMGDITPPITGIGAQIVFALSITVAPAVLEELLFRGVILQSLRRFGDGFALVASSVLFALLHQNLVQGPNALLMGLVIGYFVLRTGSVMTGMLMHLVNNSLALVMLYLPQFFPYDVLDNVYFIIYGLYVLLGVIAIIYLYLRKGNLFSVADSSYPMQSGQVSSVFFKSVGMILFLIVSAILMLLSFE